ncbi:MULTISPECIES: DUF169 domain-containing protein [unclassified Pseudodesulfovibrio]|uniref:DUF169 domain-containing protein n=1 Tax=unclassified Pseudodesulfovibrio TaxID=2661612 RepID=UPI000FEC1A76|nr:MULTISPECIES: DUF169 domain-containing protein [unclassified Pseudodesulfovibrio]MCJ2163438.1 DUF169 domain-containing protein [Pseudodesulfovibrio sp. S3-i]RWU06674.1 hypothetical protein DWB63_02610 [Pseudodesulfovibrio sp. S3]
MKRLIPKCVWSKSHVKGKKTMNSRTVKGSLGNFSEVVSFNYPAVGWYFSSEEIQDSLVFKKNKWVCMFMYLRMVMNKGKRIRFAGDSDRACTGPAEFFGFTDLEDDGGVFIAETERFKKDLETSKAYTKESASLIHPPKEKYLYMEKLEDIAEDKDIEVVNLFPANLTSLTKLVGLSGYDRFANMDNVLTPFASGCQAVFTLPYHEKFQENPKSILGLGDQLVRHFIPEDMVPFSVPSTRFVEMANNIEGSFLDKNFKNPTGF